MKAEFPQSLPANSPKDWPAIRLGTHIRFQPGFPFSSAYFTQESAGPRLIKNRDLKTDDQVYYYIGDYDPAFVVNNGDVLIGMDGDFLPCCWTKGAALLNQRVGRILPRKEVSVQFLYYHLRAPLKSIQDETGATTVKHLSHSDVENIELKLPPTLAEQEAIAAALGDADALIESLERLIAKKRDVKQGAMQELLTGKRRLPGFTGKWELKALGDLFSFSGGFSASRDQLSTEGHCYLHYGDIHKSSKTFIDVHAEAQDIPRLDIPLGRVVSGALLADGDVVFVDASEDDEGTSKHVVVINKDKATYISGLHTIVAKAKTDELAHEYRRYCFQTTAVRQQFLFYSVGTKVTGISKTNIPKLTLPLPSIPEQKAIAEILSDMDAEISVLEAKLAKARAIKQGMMQELLTGRIRLL